MYRVASLLFCLVALACTVRAEDEEHEELWEWSALFEVSASESTRNTFELRNNGEEDPLTFRVGFFVTQCASGDSEGLEAAEEVADIYFESAEHHGNATLMSGTQVILEVDHVYELAYSNESWVTSVTILFPNDGFYAIFTGHHPTELCGMEDYHSCFRDQTGAEVEILLEEEHGDHDHEEDGHDDDDRSVADRWFYTLMGCFLCWIVVFSGLIFVVCGTHHYEHFTKSYLHLMNLFASGAILSTVLFLILIEAYHFIEGVAGFTEADVAGVFGTAILAGFISPTMIELLVFNEDMEPNDVISNHELEMVEEVKYKPVHKPTQQEGGVDRGVVVVHDHEFEADLTTFEDDVPAKEENKDHDHDQASVEKTVAAKESRLQEAVPKIPFRINTTVISVICGDFLHNFCDGIFIGVAVRSCSFSLMWAIIFATMFHEFAQEISDFIILTTRVGLSIPQALTLNAMGGFSVILGGILTNLFDLSDLMIGIFLAYGSGNLIYLSAAELFPLLHTPPEGKTKLTKLDKLNGMLCFSFGAFVIGLTLLKHSHCEISESHDGH
jgi:zinc transporter ZupT